MLCAGGGAREQGKLAWHLALSTPTPDIFKINDGENSGNNQSMNFGKWISGPQIRPIGGIFILPASNVLSSMLPQRDSLIS
jgi:hypothetical protein